MNEIVFAGPIPIKIKVKAEMLIKGDSVYPGAGWKKITGLKSTLSYRLSRNYRAIAVKKGNFFVCNHDIYSRKIKYLKKAEA